MRDITPQNIYSHISSLAQKAPHRTALIACDAKGETLEEISYGELVHKIETVAAALAAKGLGAGDRVALAFPTSIGQLITSWAAWSMGVVTIPLDTKRDTKELVEYKMRASGARMKISELTPTPGSGTFSSWMPNLSHEALILFTSGTTAYPKGAQLTLQNVVVNAESIIEWLHITAEDRFIVNLPLHHINSTTFCLATLIAGGTVIVPPSYSNSGFWEQAARTGATLTSIVQSIVFDQLKRKKEFAEMKDSLKLTRIQIGSAPVVAHAAEEFVRTFHIPLYQGYGQTETSLRVTGVPMDLSAALYNEMIEENSIGTPLSWAEVEIADEQGSMLGENEEGELVVKGSAIMNGYVGGEPAFRDGYFLTGDIGFYKIIDGRRFFFLKGRKKEIIIKGGINISPVAVENNLRKISADIDQVYVVGKDDERYGEEVAAVICWKDSVDEPIAMRKLKLALFLGTPVLSPYESPKYLTSLTVRQLPTTSTGKIQRSILKKQVPTEQWSSVYDLLSTTTHIFTVVYPQSPLFARSQELHNHCWQPLIMDTDAYRIYVHENITLAAVTGEGVLSGQISFSHANDMFTCVSICSNAYKPKQVPETRTPTPAEVRTYLLAGYDPVMNFHKKLGAELVHVIPQGRPEDKSSLGFTMLLRYTVSKQSGINENDPISNQLIQAVLLLARDSGFSHIDAISRPGGLASYLAKT